AMLTDYRPTVFLPKTDFPMRGGLPQLEPKLVERWQKMRLYDKLRAASKGREKFVLHDGPPYANGDLHLGHALNKILKDVINRAQQMLGKDAPYVPGWDCQGLPIEWIAEAEVEYHDHRSNTVWVRFPIVTPSHPALTGASAVIWTTTPWTLPGNRAIAFSADLDYAVVRVDTAGEKSRAKPGEKLLVAEALIEETAKQSGIEAHTVEARFAGTALAGTVARHPLHGQGYDFDVPLLAADFVAADTGTGLVHIAPGHGADDWELGQANGLPVPDTVGPDG